MITATTTKNLDVLIIGAGMAGLTAAQELQRAGRRVLVLDKSRGIGGRMATRRIGDATFDHGAQFITARDARFVSAMEEWERQGVVKEWCRGFSAEADGHPRWRGDPSMTSLAKHLAQGLEIVTESPGRGACEVLAQVGRRKLPAACLSLPKQWC